MRFCSCRNKLLLVLFMALIFCGSARAAAEAAADAAAATKNTAESDKEIYESVALLTRVMQTLRKYYVAEDKVTYKKLVEGSLKGMLQELDPFSEYEMVEAFKHNEERYSGTIVGIGIMVVKFNDALKIVSLPDDSPGFRAGLRAGDFITAIDGKSVKNLAVGECVSLIRGQAGTKVKLTLFRNGKTSDVTVSREVIKNSPIPPNGVKSIGDIGYIRLNLFTLQAAKDLDQAMKVLEEKKVKGLILDLRNNPGGLLATAAAVCSRFLPNGKLIISTEGRTDGDCAKFYSYECEKYPDIPVVILINEFSASAAEIVAVCLKDHKRAVLIGMKTFGKGSVQKLQEIAGYGAIKFTVAKYYSPDKKLIDGNGVPPDIAVDIPPEQKIIFTYQLAREPGVLKPSGPHAVTDLQLERAIEVLKGIICFNDASKTDGAN